MCKKSRHTKGILLAGANNYRGEVIKFWGRRMDAVEKLFQLKKAKFLEAVLRAASSRKGALLPYVNFEGESCPGFRGAEVEWAHIHYESRIICISKASLSMMTDEQIQETAAHEVSHLFASLGHGTDFTQQNIITSIGSWRPPPGTVGIYGGNKVKVEEKCNHPQCEQEKELEKCPSCDVFFCKKHLAPTLEGLEKVGNEAEDLGHVCPALTEFKKVEGLRQSGLIEIHRFITKMFNVHLNVFIAEYHTPSAIGSGKEAGGVQYRKVKDAQLARLADVLEYEREKILKQKDLMTEEFFRESIDSFLFSVYEDGLKIEPHTPEVREKLLIPLSILFKSIDAYWKDTYCINKIKEIKSKLKSPPRVSPPPKEEETKTTIIYRRCASQKNRAATPLTTNKNQKTDYVVIHSSRDCTFSASAQLQRDERHESPGPHHRR